MSAAAASRDITLFHAYELLHAHNYDVAEAIKVRLLVYVCTTHELLYCYASQPALVCCGCGFYNQVSKIH